MKICKDCIQKDYLNAPSEFLPDLVCDVCEQEKPCALLPEDRLIKKHIHQEIVDEGKNPRKTRTTKAKDFKIIAGELTPLTEVVITPPNAKLAPLTDVISQELTKHNVTEALLKQMEENFLPLVINGIEDKDGYKVVDEARKQCKNTRIITVDICISGREEALRIQRDWISKEKEIVGRIRTVEDNLAAKQKVIDDERDAIKHAKEIEEQKRLQERSVKLVGNGCAFDGEHYTVEDIKISTIQVKTLDEFTFGQLLAPIEAIFKRNQTAKEAQNLERKRLAEEQLAKEDELRKRENELKAREDAIAAAELKAKQDAENSIKEKEEVRLKSRKSALFQLGYSQQGTDLLFGPNKFSEDQIKNITEEQWPEALTKITEAAIHEKNRLDKERADREAQIKNQAEETLLKKQADEKYADEVAAKEKADEAARLEQLKPDLEKLNGYMRALTTISVPEFSSTAYQEYAKTMKTAILEFCRKVYGGRPA